MREILRTVDPVEISFIQDLLRQHGIECFVFDENMSIMEGSIGVLIPRRLMVVDDDEIQARRLLEAEGIEPSKKKK